MAGRQPLDRLSSVILRGSACFRYRTWLWRLFQWRVCAVQGHYTGCRSRSPGEWLPTRSDWEATPYGRSTGCV